MSVAFAVTNPQSTALRALNYSPTIEAFKSKAGSSKCVQLGSLLAAMAPNYGAVFTRIDCAPEYGVELLSQSDMFAAEPQGRVIRRDCIPTPNNHRIQKWQVLIAGAGTLGESELYGRAIIADGRLANRYVGPHAMVLGFHDPEADLSLYTYAFFCTPVGISAVRASSYGTKVLSIRSDLLRQLPIPIPSDKTLRKVADLIRSVVANRELFKQEIDAARRPILNLPEVHEASEESSRQSRRSIVWDRELSTLSAWNYCSAGAALKVLQSRWRTKVQDVVDAKAISYGPRFTRIPCQPPFGVEFMSQRDVFTIRKVPRRIVRPLIDDESLFAMPSTILLGSCGQLGEGNLFGRAELAAFGASACAITGDTLRLVPGKGIAEALYAYLSTDLGTVLLKSTAVGTSIPRMHPALLGQLPVPDHNPQLISKVRAHVVRAVEARCNANLAELEAVRIIEEEVLPEWLA